MPEKKQVNEEARNEWTHKYLNQMFMSTRDDFVKTKYFDFIRENKIEIVSDIFERMEMDRKLRDLQMKQQKMEANGQGKFDLSEFLAQKKKILKEIEERKSPKSKRKLQLQTMNSDGTEDASKSEAVTTVEQFF